MLFQIRATLLAVVCVSAVASEDSDLCSRCACHKKAVIQSLYTINCSRRSLHHAFPQSTQWPAYAHQPQTRIAANFDRNKITHLNKFPNVSGVVSLSLRYNQMTSIEDTAFMELDNLKALDLSYNELTAEGVQADAFRGRYSAERYEPLGIVILNLGNNNIQSLSAHSFEHLPDMTELRLDYNPLSSLDSSTLLALEWPARLKVLDLAYTGISEIQQDFVEISSIQHKLKELYLNGNRFTKVPETLAALGDSLEKLNLNDNPIAEFHEDSFRGLLKLREMNISAMPHLERIGPSSFSHLRSLEILHCSFNVKLSDIDEEAFTHGDGSQTSLKQLHIMSNNLHSLSEHLVPWETLSVIDIQNNPWRCDCSLEWFVRRLVPILENSVPELLMQIHCSEPLELSGMSILAFRNPDNAQLMCDKGQSTNSISRNVTKMCISFLVIGIIIVISATIGLAALYFVRQRTNRALNFEFLKVPSIRYIKMKFSS